jgi:hypothetical protein
MIKLKLDTLNETHSLVRFANKMCGFYGHPVFLVGSQLNSETPRDVDVVCEIPDIEFKLRYFSDWLDSDLTLNQEVDKFFLAIHTGLHTEEHWNWYDDLSKKSLFGMRTLHIPIDFKVYPKSYVNENFKGLPKLRLDTRTY